MNTVKEIKKINKRNKVMDNLTYNPIDEMTTEVKENGNHKYFMVEENFYDNLVLKRADKESVPGKPEDNCDFKSKSTKRKCGYSKGGTEIGIKRRSDDKQFIITVSKLVGFNKSDVIVNHNEKTFMKTCYKNQVQMISESWFDYIEKEIDVVDKDPDTGEETPGKDTILVPIPRNELRPFIVKTEYQREVTTDDITYSINNSIFNKTPIAEVSNNLLKYVTFKQEFTNSGIKNKCKFSKSLIQDQKFDYYGIIYNINDVEVLNEIEGDENTHIDSNGLQFIEFFSAEEFMTQNENGSFTAPYHDYENNYTTVSSDLGADTTWTTGTYYLTGGSVNLGAWNLTLDGIGGDIVIKTDGVSYLGANSTGGLSTANTSSTNKVYFTSKNDDAKGETISGSNGTPTKGDQTSNYFVSWNNNTTDISYVECWYCESLGAVLRFGSNIDLATCDYTLNHITFKYCGVPTELSFDVGLMGLYRWYKAVGDVSIQNISIDNTNTLLNPSKSFAILVNESQTISLNTIYINIDTSVATPYRIINIIDIETDSTFNMKNIYCKSKSVYSSVFLNQVTNHTITINIENSIFDQDNGSGHGLYINRTSGTLTVNCYNNIAMNCSNTGKFGIIISGTMTFNESKNGYHNNDTRTSGFVATNPIDADPQLGNLIGSDIEINEDCVFPDGLAVTNYTDYEKQGSDTFDNLAVDETLLSATGRPYLGTENVTPGIMYTMDRFTYYLITDGVLTGNTELTAGTYYITTHYTLGIHSLTFNCAAGSIILKSDNGQKYIYLNSTGDFSTANTSSTNQVYLTSKNDDDHGEIISGSTGAPAKGDQDTHWLRVNADGATVNVDYLQVWYCESNTGVLSWRRSVDSPSADGTLNHVTLKYCGVPATLTYHVGLIGFYRYFVSVGDISIQNLSIDSTNSIKDSLKGYAVAFNESQSMLFNSNYIELDPSNEARYVIYFYDFETNHTLQFKNNCIKAKCAAGIVFLYQLTNYTVIFDIYSNIVDQNDGTGEGMEVRRTAGTVTTNIHNNIFKGASGVGKFGFIKTGTITFNESNNGYDNNDTNASGFTPTNPIEADPQLGTLNNVTIAPNYFLPNGFFVKNKTDYEKQGSDTFDNLGIDETKYTMTGEEYQGSENVTPGCYYELSKFSAVQYGNQKFGASAIPRMLGL